MADSLFIEAVRAVENLDNSGVPYCPGPDESVRAAYHALVARLREPYFADELYSHFSAKYIFEHAFHSGALKGLADYLESQIEDSKKPSESPQTA